MDATAARDLYPDREHVTLTDAAGPHCRCGWLPKTSGPRAQVVVNGHVSRENRKAARA